MRERRSDPEAAMFLTCTDISASRGEVKGEEYRKLLQSPHMPDIRV